jgi:hypothetical protein
VEEVVQQVQGTEVEAQCQIVLQEGGDKRQLAIDVQDMRDKAFARILNETRWSYRLTYL